MMLTSSLNHHATKGGDSRPLFFCSKLKLLLVSVEVLIFLHLVSKYMVISVLGSTMVFSAMLCDTAAPVPVGTIDSPNLFRLSPASRILIPLTLGTTTLPGGACNRGCNPTTAGC